MLAERICSATRKRCSLLHTRTGGADSSPERPEGGVLKQRDDRKQAAGPAWGSSPAKPAKAAFPNPPDRMTGTIAPPLKGIHRRSSFDQRGSGGHLSGSGQRMNSRPSSQDGGPQVRPAAEAFVGESYPGPPICPNGRPSHIRAGFRQASCASQRYGRRIERTQLCPVSHTSALIQSADSQRSWAMQFCLHGTDSMRDPDYDRQAGARGDRH